MDVCVSAALLQGEDRVRGDHGEITGKRSGTSGGKHGGNRRPQQTIPVWAAEIKRE
jgi:hypothetical protein